VSLAVRITGMKPLLALNWKLQKGPRETFEWSRALLEQLPDELSADLAIMAPAVSLQSAQNALSSSSVKWGAQDVSAHTKGAYTGETAPQWLAELRCEYVVIGHSERREYHGETDAIANQKVKASQAAKLTPILCVGEKLETREAGNQIEFTLGQLEVALDGVNIVDAESLVIAYEPIWAIGTGRTATPDDAEEMGNAMRGFLGKHYGAETAALVRLLYGGSVKPDNINALCSRSNVDGALVGGASLEIDSVLKMLEALG
jgi:triosephosphate isomerase (TIM)